MPFSRLRGDLIRYRDAALADDLVAAVIVSVLLVPQSVAYALLAGLPPEAGVYASLLPMLAYAVLGSSNVNSIGPAAVLALMTAQAIAPAVANDVPAADAALVLAIESGVMLALAALLKFDALASLLSVPVLQGFSVGASLSILLSQLPVLFGARAAGFNLVEVFGSWWRGGHGIHLATAAFGVGALVLLVIARRHATSWLGRWMPTRTAHLASRAAPLAVIVLATVVAWAVSASSAGVRLVGDLPPLHPRLTWPDVAWSVWQQLLPGAALIALVTFVSSLAVAENLGLQRGKRVSARRELMGLAGSNLAAGFGGGMPVGGSFSRTAVNAEAGARTRWAGVFAALFTGIGMLLFAAPLALLPKAVLAATIVMSVLAAGEWRGFAEAWRYSHGEAAMMAAVAAITVLKDAQWALAFGVALSIALLLQRTARPHAVVVARMPGTEHYRNVLRYATEATPGLLGIRIDESLLYINARQLPDVVVGCLDGAPGTTRVLLQMSPVNHIDFSGVEALRSLQDLLARRRVRLDLSEVKGPVLDALVASDWLRWFRGSLYLSHHQGVAAAVTPPSHPSRKPPAP
jgi:SulP family sulfate permease